MNDMDFLNDNQTAPFQYREVIEELARKLESYQSGTFALFGFNYVSKYLSIYLKGRGNKVAYIIDNDPNKQKWTFDNTPVVSFPHAEANPPDHVVICSDLYLFQMLDQIQASPQLKTLNLIYPQRDYAPHRHNSAYRRAFAATSATGLIVSLNHQKLSTLFQLLQDTKNIEGDVAEIGCAGGGTAFFMCAVMAQLNIQKDMYLFDLFDSGQESWWNDFNRLHYGQCVDQLVFHLNQFPRHHLVPGDVLQTLPKHNENKYALVHIDIGSIDAQITQILYHQMAKGGKIIYDNYAEKIVCGHKAATDSFFHDKPEKVICLPTMQGLVIKQ